MAKPVSAFVDSLLDVLSAVGEVDVRRMFGGYGVYKDGLMFGLVARDRFYLKVDEESLPLFTEAGCEQFVYERSEGRMASLSYYEPPEDAMGSAMRMRKWAEAGVAAAQRAAVKSAPKRKKKRGESPK